MKHWISLVNVPEVDQYVEIAQFAEEVGFHGISVADHLVMPTKIEESRYPYTPDGKMWWPEDTPWPDPWVTLTAMGVATKKLRLATNIYLAALRDPFTAARAVSSASVLTGGRIHCGVSVGWIKEEYTLLGLDFHTRGRRLDETIDVMKKLWTARNTSHHGEFFNFDDALISPAPHGPVPIWSGGASPAALRRAARNDGWLGVPMMAKDLIETIKGLYQKRDELNQSHESFDICCSLMEALRPDLEAELDSLGAHHNMTLPWVVTPWGRAPWLADDEDVATLDTKKLAMERYANKVIHRN
ncbi:MAG: TIGR03619 family F420-dependent LLM class oxidoreductase [Myxococcota bacterium]|nr:LLM class F420-dependent oxidoreductase [Spirochaeta sp.]RPG03720.1 MAG: TIGR03619 family F420-dependent LLM class oxidoreductase [Proteobacteria bacterium TMED72]